MTPTYVDPFRADLLRGKTSFVTGGGTLFSSPTVGTGSTWTTTGDSDGTFSEAVGTGAKYYRVQQ